MNVQRLKEAYDNARMSDSSLKISMTEASYPRIMELMQLQKEVVIDVVIEIFSFIYFYFWFLFQIEFFSCTFSIIRSFISNF